MIPHNIVGMSIGVSSRINFLSKFAAHSICERYHNQLICNDYRHCDLLCFKFRNRQELKTECSISYIGLADRSLYEGVGIQDSV